MQELITVRCFKNIPFSDKDLTLDIYIPTTEERSVPSKDTPILVFIHGGAWRYYINRITNSFRTGDKSDHQVLGYSLCERGFILFIINYTLSTPENTSTYHPLYIKDCSKALHWIRYEVMNIFVNDFYFPYSQKITFTINQTL